MSTPGPSTSGGKNQQANLDHLVRAAMSETSLNPNKPRSEVVAQFNLESERIRLRRLYMGLGTVIVLTAAGVIGWIWHSHAEAAAEAARRAEMARLTEDATAQIKSL